MPRDQAAMESSPLQMDDGSPRPTPYRPLLWLAVAAGVGVAADFHTETAIGSGGVGWWWALALALLAMFTLAARQGRSDLAAALLVGAAACLGGAWHHWHWNFIEADDLVLFARDEPQPTCVEVVLANRVKISPASDSSPLRALPARTMSEATVQVVGIRDGTEWRPASGWSRLRIAGEWHGAAQGDRLRVFAQLGKPAPPLNPGQYDWAAAERRAGRLSELYCNDRQCITVTEAAGEWQAAAWLRNIRGWCEGQLSANVAPRDAPLVLATLLGDQERISAATKDAFLQTGSIHLLVVSGMHVALLASMVWGLARLAGLSSGWRLWGTIVAVGLYAAIVGPQPSVIRATILAVTTMIALSGGRHASAGNILGAAALIVMLYNPCEIFRAGTQLSFLSVGVVIGFARWSQRQKPIDPLTRLIADSRPRLNRWFRRVAQAVMTLTVASIVVGIAIAPLVAHHFNIVTPASILLTPLAGPLVSLALYAGAALVTVGWLLPPLGTLLGVVCGGSLHLTEWIVMAAQDVPGSYAYSAGFNAWWLCVLYGAAGLMAFVPHWRPSGRWQASLALLWFTLGYGALGIGRTAPGELRCTFLGVGHGTCVVMELPSGQTILYDAGSLGSPDAACKTISSFLWSRGIDRIDAIVISHADIDHYNAVPGLVDRFPVSVVYVSPMMFDPIATDGKLDAPNYLRDVLMNRGVEMREIWMNDRLSTADPDVTIDVLFPPHEGVPGRDNANSLLLLVEFAGRRILLPGDLESPGIERVMADPPCDCDVLLAPHHGSEKSDPPGFAAWCTPEWVVMSGEAPARTLLAHRSYEEQGASVAHTASAGAVSFVFDGQVVNFAQFR